jgi:hypothetical protein
MVPFNEWFPVFVISVMSECPHKGEKTAWRRPAQVPQRKRAFCLGFGLSGFHVPTVISIGSAHKSFN